jgi:hypothetical protein
LVPGEASNYGLIYLKLGVLVSDQADEANRKANNFFRELQMFYAETALTYYFRRFPLSDQSRKSLTTSPNFSAAACMHRPTNRSCSAASRSKVNTQEEAKAAEAQLRELLAKALWVRGA